MIGVVRISRKASRSAGTKTMSPRLAVSNADVGRASVDASAMFMIARRAATTTCGGLSFGGMFVNMTDSAPAAWIGARNAKPPGRGSQQYTNEKHSYGTCHTIGKAGKDLECLQAHIFLSRQRSRWYPTSTVLAIDVGGGPAGTQYFDDRLEHAILDPCLFPLVMPNDFILERSQSGQLLSSVMREEGCVRHARHNSQCPSCKC